ncbi:hypothetical protein P154DRAFT_567851 [Amniculicola lignicola CBS 123094]|uniref:Uncharacterized protein n=1 Tax=Amniculicola lignicola CBS 123094 TaxID=1392246 RepID=A0A6A5W0J1_9PLEO|nr:hypothetical protein P154DRAFT_567851 [Amniculicola lignicola CBS 123094]
MSSDTQGCGRSSIETRSCRSQSTPSPPSRSHENHDQIPNGEGRSKGNRLGSAQASGPPMSRSARHARAYPTTNGPRFSEHLRPDTKIAEFLKKKQAPKRPQQGEQSSIRVVPGRLDLDAWRRGDVDRGRRQGERILPGSLTDEKIQPWEGSKVEEGWIPRRHHGREQIGGGDGMHMGIKESNGEKLSEDQQRTRWPRNEQQEEAGRPDGNRSEPSRRRSSFSGFGRHLGGSVNNETPYYDPISSDPLNKSQPRRDRPEVLTQQPSLTVINQPPGSPLVAESNPHYTPSRPTSTERILAYPRPGARTSRPQRSITRSHQASTSGYDGTLPPHISAFEYAIAPYLQTTTPNHPILTLYSRPPTTLVSLALSPTASSDNISILHATRARSPIKDYVKGDVGVRIRLQTLRTSLLRCRILARTHPQTISFEHESMYVRIQMIVERTAIPIAESIGYEPLVGRCFYWHGRGLFGRGLWSEAISAFENAVQMGVKVCDMAPKDEGADLEKWLRRAILRVENRDKFWNFKHKLMELGLDDRGLGQLSDGERDSDDVGNEGGEEGGDNVMGHLAQGNRKTWSETRNLKDELKVLGLEEVDLED